jgi:hypothetical protein
MTIVAIVISPPQMALRVMLTAASESSSAIDDSDSQDTDGSERQDSAANESWDSDTTESNSLMEQITDKVNQDFVGVGMPSLLSGEIRTFFY